MKKQELRPTVVTYCDYCEKEIQPPYRSIEYTDRLVDLCISKENSDDKSCFDKFLQEDRFKPKS